MGTEGGGGGGGKVYIVSSPAVCCLLSLDNWPAKHSLSSSYSPCCYPVNTIAAASSELQISSTDQPRRLFDSPDTIKVGNALDVAVEVQCTSIGGPAAARVRWSFAENGTAVEEGLKAFGTSQSSTSDGVLRIYPAASLSRSGTTFQCRDVENDQSLNVTFELRKPFSTASSIPHGITSLLYFACRGGAVLYKSQSRSHH